MQGMRRKQKHNIPMEKRVTRATVKSASVEIPQREPLLDLAKNGNENNSKSPVQSVKTDDGNAKTRNKRKQAHVVIRDLDDDKENYRVPLKRGRKPKLAPKSTPDNPKTKEDETKTTEEDDKIFKKPALPVLPRTNTSVKQTNDSPDDTWFCIQPINWPTEPREQGQYMELPLIKLANATTHMKLPSERWETKIKLNELLPAVLQRHTLTIFTGDLKVHRISENNRHKYQPDCVIFRRDGDDEPYDRVIIFRRDRFTVAIDGTLVHLNGAPEAVATLQDVYILLDILEHISLSNPMVEMVTSMSLTEEFAIKETYTDRAGITFD